jgi:uncharacterized membrane protein YkoI
MNIKKVVLPGIVALAAFAGVAGGSALTSLYASADTASTTAATSSTNSGSSTQSERDESKGGHVANGKTETLLTGDTATKAKAAAEAAVPGGTVLRVETDAEGATYEAHVQKSDGTQATVKMDANFKVTDTESGHGRGSDDSPRHN